MNAGYGLKKEINQEHRVRIEKKRSTMNAGYGLIIEINQECRVRIKKEIDEES